MSFFLLDTDTITLFQTGHPKVVRRVLAQPMTTMALSVISVEEQLGGWYTRLRRAKQPADLAYVYQRLADNVESMIPFRIVSFSEFAIHLRSDLKRKRLNIGSSDLAIAAIALEHNAIVVTRNRVDFERIPGLAIEDWSQ